ncbi:microfibril-associated glycoprotein 4-like isoform X1 [Saccostrea cucullata]|uniref:microfibril-associated glycoprotein 4-like isoform X1 n=1 Tax=Saccostrea cuccullata TaxID=36930 RepID=UPI002ED446E5
MVLVALLMSGIVCTSAQYIYPKENNRCASNGDIMLQIRDLLIQQGRIQESVDSLRRMVKRLEDDVTDIHEDVRMVKNDLNLYTDCRNYHVDGHKESGVYLIDPLGNKNLVSVFCDMETQGGGWTAIQKRISGSVGFNRGWAEYKRGFGNVTDSYWIGNDVIHQLTKGRNSSLYVSITLTNGTTLYELYHHFYVSDESDNYRLFLRGPVTGTLGDAMTGSHNLSGMSFSTPDRDNDIVSHSCAALYRGGWWFNHCHHAFLNGPWSPESWTYPWFSTVQSGTSVKGTTMMVKHN